MLSQHAVESVVGHDVADGGGADVQARAAGERARAHRFPVADVLGDQGAQQAAGGRWAGVGIFGAGTGTVNRRS